MLFWYFLAGRSFVASGPLPFVTVTLWIPEELVQCQRSGQRNRAHHGQNAPGQISEAVQHCVPFKALETRSDAISPAIHSIPFGVNLASLKACPFAGLAPALILNRPASK